MAYLLHRFRKVGSFPFLSSYLKILNYTTGIVPEYKIKEEEDRTERNHLSLIVI